MIRKLLPLMLLALVAASSAAFGQVRIVKKDGLDFTAIRRLPVLHNQRFKPLDTLAVEMVRAVTDKEKYREAPAIATFLYWRFEAEKARKEPFIKMPAAKVASAFGVKIETAGDANASFDELMANAKLRELFHEIGSKDPDTWSDDERALVGLRNRIGAFGSIAGLTDRYQQLPGDWRGLLPVIPTRGGMVPGEEYRWLDAGRIPESGYPEATIRDFATAYMALRQAWLDDDAKGFTGAAEGLLAAQAQMEYPNQFRGMDAIDREVRLNGANPFNWAKYLYAFAAFFALISLLTKNRVFQWSPLPFLLAAMGIHGWGIWERTWLSERAMIGTFYESMLFVAFGSALLALIFELWFRRKWFFLAGGVLGWLCLIVAISNPGFMNPEISKLRPVLINNYWIHIHVPTIMMSYAALALAVILAHVYLVRNLWTSARHPEMRDLSRFLYWTIPVGTILLFVGMVLGGIWADASWGRFWGWDPKETWSFITWLVFLVIIHGRWSGWLRDYGTAVGTVVGGWALLWTYYGANFFQSGLHSYAGANADKAIPAWLYGFSAFEILLLVGSGALHFARGDTSPGGKSKAVAPEVQSPTAGSSPEPAGSPS